MAHPKAKRRKFLLDELLPPRKIFTKIKERYDLKHIVHDFKKKGLKDHEVRRFAQKRRRTIITGDKYFVGRITKETSVIRITGIDTMSIGEMDNRLIKATSLYKNPSDYEGKVVTVTPNCVNERNYKGESKRLFYKKRKKRKKK